MEGRFYGLRVLHIIMMSDDSILIKLPILIVFEIVVMVIAAIMTWRKIYIILTMMLIYTMAYSICFVLYMTSDTHIKEIIIEEICRILKMENNSIDENLLLFKLLRRVSYQDEEEREVIFNIIRESLYKTDEKYCKRTIYELSSKMAWYIICKDDYSECRVDVIKKWFSCSDSTIEIKKGILAALCYEFNINRVNLCKELLVASDETCYFELIIWVITYNAYIMQYLGENIREIFIKSLVINISKFELESVIDLAIEYWREISKEEIKDVSILYRLFSMD
jgi:hypothetical protein